MYNTGSEIKSKNITIRSRLCHYSDAHILVKETTTVPNTGTAATSNNRNENVRFKNYAQFTNFISEINNKEIDHAKDIDIVMPMYNLIEYSDNYLKTSGGLWQYYRNQPFVNNNGVITDVPDYPDNASFKYKQKITGKDAIKDFHTMVPLIYLSNLEMWNWYFLTWSEEDIKVTGDYGNEKPKFAITDTKLNVPVVTLSAQDNAILLQQLKTGFKRTINRNRYQSETTL